jgi:hypothetical protein
MTGKDQRRRGKEMEKCCFTGCDEELRTVSAPCIEERVKDSQKEGARRTTYVFGPLFAIAKMPAPVKRSSG